MSGVDAPEISLGGYRDIDATGGRNRDAEVECVRAPGDQLRRSVGSDVEQPDVKLRTGRSCVSPPNERGAGGPSLAPSTENAGRRSLGRVQ
jgi:hypothetical protein